MAELRAGRKTTHWMWYVFPQLAGLGTSAMSERYALPDLAAAEAYLADPILGPRLTAAVEAALASGEVDAVRLFGPVDAAKFRSSLTLFHRAGGGPEIARALRRFFDGVEDPLTLKRL